MTLTEIIIHKIREQGPITFCDFMEMALYYPELGHYTAGKERIGAAGDYYTSPFLSPVFAAMISRQLEEMWKLMGCKPFTIVEYGAGTGLLSSEVIGCIKKIPDFYENLTYHIVEKNQSIPATIANLDNEKVHWHNDISEIEPFEGCVFSNELLDNFPVHRVIMQKELMEVCVDYKDGFVEFLIPANEELTWYLSEFNISLPEGYYTEINLDAQKWIKNISDKLIKGYMVTIDYGFDSSILYNDRHRNGTLVCYHNHRINNLPYANIGEQDITSHVNFTALIKWGINHQLDFCGLTSQANFLLALGFKEYFIKHYENSGDIQKAAELEVRLNRLLLLDMGEKFKVLIQKKGLVNSHLTGLKNHYVGNIPA